MGEKEKSNPEQHLVCAVCARNMNVLLHKISAVKKGIDSPEGILYDIEVACKNEF